MPQSQQRRSGRTKPRVVYEEPKLGSKQRQVKRACKLLRSPTVALDLPDVNDCRHDCCESVIS